MYVGHIQIVLEMYIAWNFSQVQKTVRNKVITVY